MYSTNPRFCCFVVLVGVDHGVEDEEDGEGGVVGGEGHQAAELALVHDVHVGSKQGDFGHTVKCDF